jgi:hypothetical protein
MASRSAQRFSKACRSPRLTVFCPDLAEEMQRPPLACFLAGIARRIERPSPRIQRAVRVSGEQKGFTELGELQPEAEAEADRLVSGHRLLASSCST